MSDSLQRFDTIVSVASWEPRFLFGIARLLRRYSTRRLLLFFMSEYQHRTADARDRTEQLIRQVPGTEFEEQRIHFGMPEQTWRTLESRLGPPAQVGKTVLVDLTTMPREIIWSVLFWLETSGAELHYVYHQPASYAGDWLARDPNHPRFVFKLAGTLEIDRPTALVAVTGFDENRCRQAIEFYEPIRVLLAAQRGVQFNNDERNVGRSFVADGVSIDRLEIDAYSQDHGYGALRKRVELLTKNHNVILCSFGPKLSAIALYRIQREFPQTALAYIGCKEYNSNYSSGIEESLVGEMSWSSTGK